MVGKLKMIKIDENAFELDLFAIWNRLLLANTFH